MKLERLPNAPGELLKFYEEGLTKLGALCERTWHDRLEVVAEGPAARLWHPDGALHEIELQFAAADTASARDARREVFPGCPLTFQLAEALRPSPLPLERFVLEEPPLARLPEPHILEKLWRSQFPDTTRWHLAVPLQSAYHFTLLTFARCEIQAIDQHWSMHRTAVSLADGETDSVLSREISFHQNAGNSMAAIPWPSPDPPRWHELLRRSLERELSPELERIRARQENSLRRELERIDDYFDSYKRELMSRARRSSNNNSKLKAADRLAAADAEHARRRADQLARHEIRVHPHIDALLLVAEKAWRAQLRVETPRRRREIDAQFIPRLRQWRLTGEVSLS
jgi:hypothetical protein